MVNRFQGREDDSELYAGNRDSKTVGGYNSAQDKLLAQSAESL